MNGSSGSILGLASSAQPAVPGWYGKLPAFGDFASRRLPVAFVDAWDHWLSCGLAQLREDAPDTWLTAYLDSPVWRFVLMPGVVPGSSSELGWAGVLMPSVDRVGRYFPMTLACPLVAPACAASPALWHWLAQLDELAADALYGDWPIERLESALTSMSPPPCAPAGAILPKQMPGAVVCVDEQSGWDHNPCEAIPDAAATIAATAMQAACLHGLSWWQSEPKEAGRQLRVSRGLPAPGAFMHLFGTPVSEI
jgi:type VI secretion system protein ImpM